MTTHKSGRAVLLLFAGFLGALFLLNLALPDRSFSERENRYLQTRPAFSLKSLFSGQFTSDYETYCSDQFVLRDAWTTLKARCELLSGKKENNGIFLCDGDRLIEPFAAPSDAVLDAQTAAVNTYAEKTGLPVTLGLIPGASEIYAALLPDGVPNDSQRDVIHAAYQSAETATADLDGVLASHAGEYIYYRTDHHWTTLGAYYGYTALCRVWEIAPHPLSAYDRETVSGRFYGTTYSSSGFSWVQPDSMERFVAAPAGLQVERYDGQTPVECFLYNEDRLAGKDKYTYFLGGNTPLLVIRGGTEGLPSLLIIRDSYSDCLAPFLLEYFSEIHLLDLRYYLGSAADYAAENHIDRVLILYSVGNFCTDTNIQKLAD